MYSSCEEITLVLDCVSQNLHLLISSAQPYLYAAAC